MHLALFRAALAPLLWLAAQGALPPLRGHVNDLAAAMPAAARAALDAELTAYEARTGQQIVVLTVASLDNEPVESYALRVAEAWQLGRRGKDDGLLLLVAPHEHKMRIEVGYGLEGQVTDVLAHRIVVQLMRPAFRAGDYAGGIRAAVAALMQAAAGEAVTTLPPPPAAESERRGSLSGGALLVLLLLLLLPVLLLPPRRGWGGGGWGGGGWGGGGGSGGFSGGGGSFGGGGASGNW